MQLQGCGAFGVPDLPGQSATLWQVSPEREEAPGASLRPFRPSSLEKQLGRGVACWYLPL